eukprot:TRINITY_DN7339_c0_g1_i1.p1 TRINITY_DN7339_c0_g1~~TRINITY_DN7339_c0_g1_i1.p1  ORF type:complete len:337 (-),score=0.91 TRINITY_DN7339_c0_g1_i1:238-1248(-)
MLSSETKALASKMEENGNGKGFSSRRPGNELRVCLPARTPMSFMPKPILSPGRSGDATKRNRNGPSRGQSSPMFPVRTDRRRKGNGREKYDVEEPTSPKVTCAGQVRVRPAKSQHNHHSTCRNWQTVMEKMEKMHLQHQRKGRIGSLARVRVSTPGSSPRRTGTSHNHSNQPVWTQLMQFMTALRNLKVDFGCFGPPSPSFTEDDEDEAEEEAVSRPTTSGTFFAKWLMILQDEEGLRDSKTDLKPKIDDDSIANSEPSSVIPPPNALLLMRCRSAPSAGDNGLRRSEEISARDSDSDAVILKRCGDPEFSKLSLEVSKETWLCRAPLSRSLSLRS